MNTNENILKLASEVFDIESQEILNLKNLLTIDFCNSISSILNCSGKVIITGMGKSGIIGKKIAASLSSTGTESFFLHPGEAYHGDLGMIGINDIVILISNSGETDEILKLIPFLKNNKNITISMTGNPLSTLSKNTNYHLNISVEKEACPLQLAPTSSTTATLVMGDALTVVLMKMRDFKDENFAKFHPGGSLGKRLLTTVNDLMIKNNLPIVLKNTNIKDVVHSMTESGMGLTIVCEDNKILGIITDGDIRRSMEYKQDNFFNLTSCDLMNINPKTVSSKTRIFDAEEQMKEYKVNSLLVVNEKEELIGVLKIFDIEK